MNDTDQMKQKIQQYWVSQKVPVLIKRREKTCGVLAVSNHSTDNRNSSYIHARHFSLQFEISYAYEKISKSENGVHQLVRNRLHTEGLGSGVIVLIVLSKRPRYSAPFEEIIKPN